MLRIFLGVHMLVLEIAVGIILFVLGYVLGRVNLIGKALQKPEETQYLGKPRQSTGWTLSSQEQHKPIRVVDIDDSKFVTDVSTDSFKSKHTELGKTTVTEDKVSSSVSKLKRLKGE